MVRMIINCKILSERHLLEDKEGRNCKDLLVCEWLDSMWLWMKISVLKEEQSTSKVKDPKLLSFVTIQEFLQLRRAESRVFQLQHESLRSVGKKKQTRGHFYVRPIVGISLNEGFMKQTAFPSLWR